jgi:anti-sigma B factor antagonist
MQSTDTNWQARPFYRAAFSSDKESTLKLSLETRSRGNVIIVHCQGRAVYRDEAAALSRVVGNFMSHARKLVLDLSGVSFMDSAGIGTLALLYSSAQKENVEFKIAAPSSFVRGLLDLTKLDSVLEIHDSVNDALEAFRENGVCADC